MPAPRLIARVPKARLNLERPRQGVRKWLNEVGDDLVAAMQFYPPKQPWRLGVRTFGPERVGGPNRRLMSLGYPTSGERVGGRRTLKYRKGWRKVVKAYSVEVINNVSYAPYVGGSRRRDVGGPRQAKHMRRRGWPSVTDVGPVVRARHRESLERILRVL